VQVLDKNAVITNVIAEECSNGFQVDDTGALIAHNTSLTNCTAIRASISASTRGFKIGTTGAAMENCRLTSCKATGFAEGLNIGANAIDTTVMSCNFTGNTSAVSDTSATSHYKMNVGYVTESYVLSSNLAIDSTGTKSTTINHGLSVTPEAKNISLSLIRNTAVTDHVLGFWWIETITSTTVAVRLRVMTASGTAGAVANLAVAINAKP